jgi:predicted phage baseplate assembly protein
MALPNITLDDRSFDQLFAFMRKQIDVKLHTDHNYSDPGIVLLDLLCWIAESIIYRTDRIPDAHVERFANLILDPPEPVTVPLTLTATLNQGRTGPLVVKAGTRFATDFLAAADGGPPRRIIFETLTPVTFQAPLPLVQSSVVTARECLVVAGQPIGTSDGTPNQVFALRPVHASLNLAVNVPTPVLLDFTYATADYNPNPHVTVDGDPWELKLSLLTKDSSKAKHYMVDANAGAIRFGDGEYGLIPPNGAKIVCTYQVLQGPDALVARKTVVNRLDAAGDLAVGETLDVVSGQAEGGAFFFPSDTRLAEGLKGFRRPYRLITAGDFEEVMLKDFSDYEGQVRRRDANQPARQILRATALMNYRSNARQQPSPGCVTLIVLAEKDDALAGTPTDRGRRAFERKLTDPTIEDAAKRDLVALSTDFVDAVTRFLDKRRLIATRVFVQPPSLTPVSIAVQVTVASDRNTDEMTQHISDAIRGFLGVVTGGIDGKGWPLGGGIYRSRLYWLIESLDGVDHVDALSLGQAVPDTDLVLDPLSLPILHKLAISVTRA